MKRRRSKGHGFARNGVEGHSLNRVSSYRGGIRL